MRRGEMVYRLQQILEDYQDCEMDSEVACKILEGLENLGMLPPVHTKTVAQDQGDDTAFVYTLHRNEWESEDS